MKALDSSFTVQTPEGIEFALYPAGFLVRGCAWAIDAVFSWIAIIVVNILSAYISRVFGWWLFLLVYFAIDWFYHIICELAFRGQSPGKRILGLRVVKSDGSPVTPGASFLRNLLRFADVFMLLNLTALLCISFSTGFRRVGDWAGDTLVVYSGSHEAFRRSLTWIAAVPVVSPPRALSGEEKQAILMFAYRYPLLGPARADEIARDYAAALRGDAESPAGAADYLLGIAHRLSGDAL